MKFLRHFLEGAPIPLAPSESKKLPPPLTELKRMLSKDTETENKLISSEVAKKRKLGGGINVSEIIELKRDGRAVFKPKDGETTMDGYESGSLYKRERAAYLISRFLDLDLVPPTVVKEVDGEIGSAQEFVPDGETPDSLGFKIRQAFEIKNLMELIKLWIFDYIIWNTDRHRGNLLFRKDGKVAAIDNGFSFAKSRYKLELYEVSGINFFGQKILPEIISKFQLFLTDVELKMTLRNLLSEYLPENEVAACFARIEKIGKVIIEQGNIPKNFENDFNPT